MRVLVANSFSDRSETALWQGLTRAGVEVDVLCDPSAPERETLTGAGLRVGSLHTRHRLDFPAARQLRTALTDGRHDILHTTRNRELAVALLATRGLAVKVVAYRGTVGRLSRWDPVSWLTYLHPRVSRIVCVSDAVRRSLLALGIRPDTLVTIHKGFDPSWYTPLSRDALGTFGIPSEAFVVGFAGDMRPVKGVPHLIRSADRLPADLNVHYLLVGRVRDEQLRALAQTTRDPGRFHFTGFRPDAPSLMGACDAFVLPSLSREGIGKAMIEAMAQGVPPIASCVGGIPEVVEDGTSGLLVPPGDSQGIADAITRLARDASVRMTLGRRARERILRCFSVERAVEKTWALYRSLL